MGECSDEVGGVGVVLRVFVRSLIAALLFIAPLKFGSVVNTGAISLFPFGWLEWVIAVWPPFLAPVLCGIALLGATVVYPPPAQLRRHWLVPAVWLVLFGVCVLGLLRTTEWDYALLFLWHLLGVFCLAASVAWVLPRDPCLRRWALTAVMTAVFLTLISGWYQVKGGGYAETLEYIERTAEIQGGEIPAEIRDRLMQGRASASFIYPNSFAAHLILTGPLFLVCLWQIGGRFTPSGLSRALFLFVGGGLFAGGLIVSGSRAAVAGLGGGVVIAVMCYPGLKRWRLPLATLGFVCAVALFAFVSRGRTLSSLEARMDYYRTGVEMAVRHPVAGVGLGEFFPYYLRLKPLAAEETRAPHNVAVFFVSQTGVWGVIGAVVLLALPIGFVSFVRPRDRLGGANSLWLTAAQCGLAAWSLHALLDFNIQIPGTVMTVAIIPLICVPPEQRKEKSGQLWVRLVFTGIAVVSIGALWRWSGERAYGVLTRQAAKPFVNIVRLREQSEKARARLPFSPHPDALFAKAAAARGYHAMAAEAYAGALHRTPHRGGWWYALAEQRLLCGDVAAARAAMKKAIYWDPGNSVRDPLEARIRRVGVQ
ncbi:MAG: O-antigen ligase family protein [Candidatus Pacebacteria bacterium]|nr:O-antigen ligase family protein [Candidatus Paceibacterota bacterium]